MVIRSSFDPETEYKLKTDYMKMVRGTDSLTIPYGHIPEQAKRFVPEIQEELMDIWREHFPTKTCEVCGKQFHSSRPRKYCSPECSRIANLRNSTEWNRKYRNQPSTKNCAYCGQPFIVTHCGRRKYCSDDCYKHAHSESRKNNKEEKKERVSQLNEKLQLAESKGMTYAEMQKEETLKMVGRVVI